MQNINYKKTIFIALFILISTSSLLLAKPYKVFPILMVHGNSGNFGSWQYDNSIYLGTITFLNNLYSNCYGDRNSRYLPVEYHSALKMTYSEIGNLSIFGLSFTKNKGPILDNSEELDMVINGVSGPPPGEAGQVPLEGIREIMSKAYPEIFQSPDDVKVVIIAHSMGGLNSRKYIQDHPSNHHIAKLITVATPHLGSDFMNAVGVAPTRMVLAATIMYVLALTPPTNIFCGWMLPWATFIITEIYPWYLSIGLVYGITLPLYNPGNLEMHPFSGDICGSYGLNNMALNPIVTNLDYRLIGGRLGLGWRTAANIANIFCLGGIPSTFTDGDGLVAQGSALASGGSIFETPFPNGVDVLKNSRHWLVEDKNHGSIIGAHEEILKALEDPPIISNVVLFTSDSKPLANNTLQDITKPGIIITGNLWDYLLHKLDAKLVFSNQIAQQIDFDTFGYFSETATLAAGGKNTVFVMANNPANYYSASNPHNIYLVGISYPRDGMILIPENSSQFQYFILDSSGSVITTEVQSLSFGDYGGALPEKNIDLPTNTYKLSKPQYLNGEINPDIVFLDENGNLLEPDESGNYKIEGMTRFKAKLNNDYQGKTFVKLQGNADASQWNGYNIEIGEGENPTVWDVKSFSSKIPGPMYGTLYTWQTTGLNGQYQVKCRISGQEVNSTTYYLGTKVPGTDDNWSATAYDSYRKMELWFPPQALKGRNYITISPLDTISKVNLATTLPNPLFKPVGHIYEIKPGLTADDFNADTSGQKQKASLKFKYTYEDIDFDITGDEIADTELIKNNLGLYKIVSGKLQLVYSENKPDSFILIAPINDFSDSFVVLPNNSPPKISQPFCSPFIFTPGKVNRDTTTLYYNISDGSSNKVWVIAKIIDKDSNVVRVLSNNKEETLAYVQSKLCHYNSFEQLWDGKNDSGDTVPDGAYVIKIQVMNGAGNIAERTCVVVKSKIPIGITSPKDGETINGVISLYGNAVNPAGFAGYSIFYALSPDTSSWTPIPVPSSYWCTDPNVSLIQITNGLLATWNTMQVPNGNYVLKMNILDSDGLLLDTATVNVNVDNVFEIYNFSASPNPFSPDNNGIKDTTTIHYSIPVKTHINISIYNETGVFIATLVNEDKPAGSHSVEWGGTGVIDGNYWCTITASETFTDKKGMIITRDTSSVDITANITSPSLGSVSGVVDITGTADVSNSNFGFYLVEYGWGETPSSWNGTGDTITSAVTSGTLASWNTWDIADDTYAIRLTVQDKAGNTKTTIVAPLNVFNILKVEINVSPDVFSPDTDGIKDTAVITYTISKDVDISYLRIYPGTDTTASPIKTFISETLAGVHTAKWNGRNDSLSPCTAGFYTCVFSARKGSSVDTEVAGITLDRGINPPANLASSIFNYGVEDGKPYFGWCATGNGVYYPWQHFGYTITARGIEYYPTQKNQELYITCGAWDGTSDQKLFYIPYGQNVTTYIKIYGDFQAFGAQDFGAQCLNPYIGVSPSHNETTWWYPIFFPPYFFRWYEGYGSQWLNPDSYYMYAWILAPWSWTINNPRINIKVWWNVPTTREWQQIETGTSRVNLTQRRKYITSYAGGIGSGGPDILSINYPSTRYSTEDTSITVATYIGDTDTVDSRTGMLFASTDVSEAWSTSGMSSDNVIYYGETSSIDIFKKLNYAPCDLIYEPHYSKWVISGPYYPGTNSLNSDILLTDLSGKVQGETLVVSVDTTTYTFDDRFTARLKIPYSGKTFIKITGSANCSSFSKYYLEYGKGESPEKWNLIKESNVPVDTGTLAYWNVTRLNGIYTLVLTVFDGDRNLKESQKTTLQIGQLISAENGGVATDPYAQTTINFPRGSLKSDKLVTISVVDSSEIPVFNPDFQPTGPTFIFSPSISKEDFITDTNGEVIKPATLTFHYDPSELTFPETMLGLFVFHPSTQELKYLPCYIDTMTYTVTAQIEGFSYFFLSKSHIPSVNIQSDTEPPAKPTGLNITITQPDEPIYLTWDHNREIDFAYYVIYCDGIAIDTTTNNKYEGGLLLGNQSPVYTVTAVDLARNQSSHSDSASATLIEIASVVSLYPGADKPIKMNNTETVTIFCQVYSPGVTDGAGKGESISGQVWLSKKGSYKIEEGVYTQESEGYMFGLPGNWPGYSSYIATVDAKFEGENSELLGMAFRLIDENNFYLLSWSEGKLKIKKVIEGSSPIDLYTPATVYSFPQLNNEWVTLKIKVMGSYFYAKMWQKGQNEPPEWQIWGRDDSLLSGGFALVTYNAKVSFDNLRITELEAAVSQFLVDSQADWEAGTYYHTEGISSPGAVKLSLGLPQLSNITAFWQLEETSGTLYDQTSNDNNGTPHNSPAVVDGKIGNARQFVTGLAQWVETPNHSISSSSVFTVSAWVKIPTYDAGSRKQVMGQGDNTTYVEQFGWGMLVGTTLTFSCEKHSGGWKHVYGGPDLRDNAWHLVAVTYNNGSIKLYVDGSLVGSGTYTESASAGAQILGIGAWTRNNSPSEYFNGVIDEPIIWEGKALTEDEHSILYADGSPTRSAYTLGNYYTSGTYVSAAHNSGVDTPYYGIFEADYNTNGQNITFDVRTADPKEKLSSARWYRAYNGHKIYGLPDKKWVQFRCQMATDNPSVSPVVNSVTVNYATSYEPDGQFSNNFSDTSQIVESINGILRTMDMDYLQDRGINDEYKTTIGPLPIGEYQYTTRFSGNNGNTWKYSSEIGTISVVLPDTVPPVAEISNPRENDILSGIVNIIGTAIDTDNLGRSNLKKYVLEYGLGTNPYFWKEICSSGDTKVNTILGAWNTSNIEDNIYVIRLIGEDSMGNTREDSKTVIVHNKRRESMDITNLSYPEFLIPEKDTATISFNLSKPQALNMEVYDWNYNAIKMGEYKNKNIGINSEMWNGKDIMGQDVPDGAYFFEFNLLPEATEVINSDTMVYFLKFGEFGAGNAKFNYPLGMAIDYRGNILVCDMGNNRIQKFTSDGRFVSKFGEIGEASLKSPRDIAIDNEENILVIDSGDPTIPGPIPLMYKFNSDGWKIWERGGYGDEDGKFKNPVSISLDIAGNIYVADKEKNCIQRFDKDGNFVLKIGSGNTGEDTQLSQPIDIYVDSLGFVYVVDSGNSCVKKFDRNGNFIWKLGPFILNGEQFISPQAITLDPSEKYIYVSDIGKHSIQKFSQFDNIGNPQIPTFSMKISGYDTQSQISGSYDTETQFTTPMSLLIDSSGKNFYISDSTNNRIMRYKQGAGWIGVDSTPPQSAFTPSVSLYKNLYSSPTNTYTITSTDPEVNKVSSGIAVIEYQVDGGQWIVYADSFSLSEGMHFVNYRAVDRAGNIEENKMFFVMVSNPPKTDVRIDSPSYYSEILKATVITSASTISLVVVGDTAQVARIEYRLDTETVWNTYTGPFTIPTEGVHIISCYAFDTMGNAELIPNMFTVIVDNSPPSTQLTLVGPQHGTAPAYITSGTMIRLTAYDTFAGVNRIGYKIDGSEWKSDTSSIINISFESEETHTILFHAIDNLGNIEETKSISVFVDNTAPTITINIFYSKEDTFTINILVSDNADSNPRIFASLVSSATGAGTIPIYSGYWETEPFIVPSGEWILTVYAKDFVGNVSTESRGPLSGPFIIIHDILPPRTSIVIGEPKYGETPAFVTSATTLTLSAVDDLVEIRDSIGLGVAKTEYRSETETIWDTYTLPFNITGEGTHTIYFRSIDKVGNTEETKSITVFVDNAAPTITINVPSPGETYVAKKDKLKIDFTVIDNADTDPQVVTFLTHIDTGGETIPVYNGWETDPLNIPSGQWILTVQVKDFVENTRVETSGQFTIIHDILPPRTSITIGEPKYGETPTLISSTTTFTLTVIDDLIEVGDSIGLGIANTYYRIDNETWSTYVSSFNIPSESFTYGIHAISYYSTDNVLNKEKENTRTVFLDNIAPVCELTSPSKQDYGLCKIINNETVPIIGNVFDQHFLNYRVEIKKEGEPDTQWQTIIESSEQKANQELAILNTLGLADGYYILRITAIDRVNNTSIDSPSIYIGKPELLLTIGGKGKEQGKFNHPYGICLDDTGNIYITDSLNHRIQKFSPEGNFILEFGKHGKKEKEFNGPSGIAISKGESPAIYVANRNNDRIQVFDLNGNFLYSFGKNGHNPSEFNKPEGIFIDSQNKLYVTDRNNDRIQKFDSHGTFLAQFTGFNKPEGVFVDSKSNIYIADRNNDRVVKLNSNGETMLVVTGLNKPNSVIVNSRGYIYVSNTNSDSIAKFDKYGNLVAKFLSVNGDSPNLFLNKPAGLTIDKKGNLLIVDENNNRVIKIGAPDTSTQSSSSMRALVSPNIQVKSIKDAYAYPVPFKPGPGHTAIRFTGLTSNVQLRIYNIAGELIFEKDNLSGNYDWHAQNNYNEPVSSGVYIYFLTDDTKEKKIGKIVVIR